MVADRKITSVNELDSISFDYKNKLYGILGGVIFGSSGSTDTFELFRDHIIKEVKKSTNEITYDNVTIKLCDLVLDINKKRDYMKKHYFELLVAIRHPDKPSSLVLITGVGAKRQIETYDTLGIGRIFAKEFLDKLWYPGISMKECATIGWFIIKHIEDNKLHSAVGVSKYPPHIWFIPDDERKDGQKIDYETKHDTTPELFQEIRNNALKMFRKHQRQINKLSSV